LFLSSLEDKAQKIKTAALIAPHVATLTGGFMSKNLKTTISGAVGVLAVLLNTFGIVELSTETQLAIVTVSLGLVGYFSRDKGNGSDAPIPKI